MRTHLELTVSPPMEFMYSLFALGTGKGFFNTIRAFDLEPDETITETLQDMRQGLSRYIQQELSYFFDISGVGYILYKYIVRNPEINHVEEILERLRSEPADDFVFNIIQSVCKNVLPNQEPGSRGNPKGDKAALLQLVEQAKFQDDQRKGRVVEAVENPEEVKLRFYLLLSQFYTRTFKPIEKVILQRLEEAKIKYAGLLEDNPGQFIEQFIGLDGLKEQQSGYIVHVSFFKYVSCHGYSSYDPDIADWFVLGIHTDLLFNEQMQAEKQAAFFKVLSDVNRIAILRLLSERSWFGQELAEKLNISPPTVSYHISFLQQIGVVSFVRMDNRFYYSLDRSKLMKPLEDFISCFKPQ